MKFISVFSVVALFVLSFSAFSKAENVCFEGLQKISFVDLKGEKAGIPDNQGRVILINLWATWCGPCRREIAHINAFYEDFKTEDIDFIGISLDTLNLKQISRFAEEMGIQYPVLVASPTEVMKSLSIAGVPATIIIDKDRKKNRRLLGLHTKDELKEIVSGFLNIKTQKEAK